MLYTSITCRLKTQYLAISEVIKNIDEQRLNYKHEPGRWSIKDNIAHLVTYQPVFIGRIHQILKGDTPMFGAYRADDDPEFINAVDWSLTDLINKLNGNRLQILELITNLPDDQLLLKGIHPKYGTLTITEWTEFFLLHEAHHLFTIFKMAKA